jgi:hypothetical protein
VDDADRLAALAEKRFISLGSFVRLTRKPKPASEYIEIRPRES